MAVSHEATEGGTAYTTWGFGNRHGSPALPAAERPIIISQVPGLSGEAHQIDQRKGRDLFLAVTYAGAASVAALKSSVATDDGQSLRGALLIDSVSYGNATFLGITVIPDPGGNGWRRDGITGTYFCDAIARWRLRT
jgi:hypothetical protein